MTDRNETLADIVAEMRRSVTEHYANRTLPSPEQIGVYANRIEEAQGRQTVMRDLLRDDTKMVGNAAKLREALEAMVAFWGIHGGAYSVRVCPVRDNPEEVEAERVSVMARGKAALMPKTRTHSCGKTGFSSSIGFSRRSRKEATMPTTELNPCPFCGKSKLVKICENPSAKKNGRGWFVSHGGKACVLAGYSSRGFATPEEAAAAWNRRAPADANDKPPAIACPECGSTLVMPFDDGTRWCDECGHEWKESNPVMQGKEGGQP